MSSTEFGNKQNMDGSKSGARYLWIAGVCALLMAVAYALRSDQFEIPVEHYLPVHLVLEFSSIVVSFSVFAIAWYGYKRTGSVKDLVIGVTFFTTGVFDFIHSFNYQGMPEIWGVHTAGRAAGYWLAARLVVGIGIVAAALISPKNRGKWLPVSLMAASLGLIAVIVALLSVYHPYAGELFFKNGLTPLKIALEYVIIATYLAAFVLVSEKRGWEPRVVVWLRGALIVAIFAEFAFTLYLSPYGMMNAFGHIYKTAAYYMILNALFVSAVLKPYDELSTAKDKLQELYLDAQEHRREMEESFSRIGSALSSSLMLDEALDQIAELAADMAHADCAIVVALDGKGDSVRFAAQKGGCHDVHRPVDVTLLAGRDVIAQHKPVVINDLQQTGWIQCDFTHRNCLRSMICAPMIYEGEVLGLVSVYSHSKNAFEEGDINLIEGFAAHAGVAIHNTLSYERESRIANVLQKTFMSTSKLETDGFDIAQVYEPASNEALVGGDFYDVVELPGNKIALVIGDVSGKGLSAAVHTAMAKYTLRAFLIEGHSPGKALSLLDAAVEAATADDVFITMFLGILDTQTSVLTYANAGHEPPVFSCDGSYLTLQSTGPAVGLGIGLGYEEGSITLSKGSILLMYTDGISEARRDTILMGTERIGEELLTCHELVSDDVAKCVHDAAKSFAGGELRDDAAILAVRAKSRE